MVIWSEPQTRRKKCGMWCWTRWQVQAWLVGKYKPDL